MGLVVSIREVSKTYGKKQVPAVDSLNLEIREGEIFGFIGPNGAGKTTTIKMLTGILPPDKGSIVIDGVELVKNPVEAKMKIGYVPDNPNIYERLTGMEYLEFIGDVYGVPYAERRERISKYMKMFEMEFSFNDQIRSYSHGMRQKLLITGALLHNPKVWILDEPLTGLDPRSSFLLKEQMKEHKNNGNTVFFSTHILEVAEKLCDRIGIIDKGRLILVGTIEELKEKAQKNSSLEDVFMTITGQEG